MKKRHKLYLKINLMSLVFIFVSFISVTLAWFAYSGTSSFLTDVDVRAWYVEFDKNGEKVSNDIVISLSEIYPGMTSVDELIKIKNLGDSPAQLTYSIVSARILGDNDDNYAIKNDITSPYVEDLLSHKYPFHINISMKKKFILSHGDESEFEVSVSWPLDSGNDKKDSEWGNRAYLFQKNETDNYNKDKSYQKRSSIQIVISVVAEQYVESDTSTDYNYYLGKEILYDVSNKKLCTTALGTCIKTNVIDIDNKLGDESVTLLPSLYNSYASSNYSSYDTTLSSVITGYTVPTRALTLNDILPIVATDIVGSNIVIPNISDAIIGDLKYGTRFNTELSRVISKNGYYSFKTNNYNYLFSDSCYWVKTEYDTNKAFAVNMNDVNSTKIYGLDKTNNCKVVPVLVVNKAFLHE